MLTPDDADEPLAPEGADTFEATMGEVIEDERRPIWIPPPHLVLGLALVLSLPSIVNFAGGTLNLSGILVRFLIALAVAWVGLLIVGNVVNAYMPPPEPAPPMVPHALEEGDDLSHLAEYAPGEGAVPDSGAAGNEPGQQSPADAEGG